MVFEKQINVREAVRKSGLLRRSEKIHQGERLAELFSL
jgi:hypothetical protein